VAVGHRRYRSWRRDLWFGRLVFHQHNDTCASIWENPALQTENESTHYSHSKPMRSDFVERYCWRAAERVVLGIGIKTVCNFGRFKPIGLPPKLPVKPLRAQTCFGSLIQIYKD